MGKAGMQPPQKNRLKKGPEMKHFVAQQMQKISYARVRANPKNHILMNLDKKRA